MKTHSAFLVATLCLFAASDVAGAGTVKPGETHRIDDPTLDVDQCFSTITRYEASHGAVSKVQEQLFVITAEPVHIAYMRWSINARAYESHEEVNLSHHAPKPPDVEIGDLVMAEKTVLKRDGRTYESPWMFIRLVKQDGKILPGEKVSLPEGLLTEEALRFGPLPEVPPSERAVALVHERLFHIQGEPVRLWLGRWSVHGETLWGAEEAKLSLDGVDKPDVQSGDIVIASRVVRKLAAKIYETQWIFLRLIHREGELSAAEQLEKSRGSSPDQQNVRICTLLRGKESDAPEDEDDGTPSSGRAAHRSPANAVDPDTEDYRELDLDSSVPSPCGTFDAEVRGMDGGWFLQSVWIHDRKTGERYRLPDEKTGLPVQEPPRFSSDGKMLVVVSGSSSSGTKPFIYRRGKDGKFSLIARFKPYDAWKQAAKEKNFPAHRGPDHLYSTLLKVDGKKNEIHAVIRGDAWRVVVRDGQGQRSYEGFDPIGVIFDCTTKKYRIMPKPPDNWEEKARAVRMVFEGPKRTVTGIVVHPEGYALAPLEALKDGTKMAARVDGLETKLGKAHRSDEAGLFLIEINEAKSRGFLSFGADRPQKPGDPLTVIAQPDLASKEKDVLVSKATVLAPRDGALAQNGRFFVDVKDDRVPPFAALVDPGGRLVGFLSASKPQVGSPWEARTVLGSAVKELLEKAKLKKIESGSVPKGDALRKASIQIIIHGRGK